MLTKQEFKFKNQEIKLERCADGFDRITVITGPSDEFTTQTIALDPVAMRKLARVLRDSPFIFSECNGEDK